VAYSECPILRGGLVVGGKVCSGVEDGDGRLTVSVPSDGDGGNPVTAVGW